MSDFLGKDFDLFIYLSVVLTQRKVILMNACIFDLDGVIVDTAKYHFIAWQSLAHNLGIEFTEEDNESLKGVGRMESLDFILKLGGLEKPKEELEKLAFAKNEHYKSLITDMNKSELLPGVEDFLIQLKENNIKISLGSSSKNAGNIIKLCEIEYLFDAIVDGRHLTKSKPDPQVFLLGSEALNIPPSQIVVFEDAVSGVQAANTGGFYSVGVGDPKILNEADYNIQGFEKLSVQEIKAAYNKE